MIVCKSRVGLGFATDLKVGAHSGASWGVAAAKPAHGLHPAIGGLAGSGSSG